MSTTIKRIALQRNPGRFLLRRHWDNLAGGRSHSCYSRAFETSEVPLVIHDAGGLIVAANARACEILGCTQEQILGMQLADLDAICKLPLGAMKLRFKAAKKEVVGVDEAPLGNFEPMRSPGHFAGRRPSDEYHLYALPLSNESGKHRTNESHTIGESTNSSSPKIRSAPVMANLNHEIRTPLQAVMGMTDLLLETSVTKKQKTYLESIRNSGQILLKIINDTLDYSALQSGRIGVQKSNVDVDDVISQVLVMLGGVAYSKDIELACRIDTRQFRAIGDSDRIRQVLTNLVGNAIKFTDRGEVIVDASMSRDSDGRAWVEFAVTDSGPGIDDATKSDLFMPFARAGSTVAHRHEGAGLGLTISKNLVELMGGRIDIQSRSDARGTVAWFCVPAEESVADSSKKLSGVTAGSRVLVIDDNRLIGEATCGLLRCIGLEAELELDGTLALERLENVASTRPYRIAMIDSDMLAVDGVAVASAIRSRKVLENTSIVMMTSLAEPLRPGDASRINAVCLDKPIAPVPLARIIDQVMAEKQAPAGESSAMPDRVTSSILVAEDNPVSRQIFCDMLEYLGFEVDAVENGTLALEAVASKAYRLALVDCQMPDIDGDEVAAAIKGRFEAGSGPIVVAISATASAETKARCNRAGADDFLAKPVTLRTLRAALAQWLPDEPRRVKAAPPGEETGGQADPQHRASRETVPISAELMELFVSDSAQRIESMSNLLASPTPDTGKIARESHALKSGSLFIGQYWLAVFAGKLEEVVRDGDLGRADAIFNQLRGEFERFRAQHEISGTPECNQIV